MIRSKLTILLAERHLSITRASEETGISRTTLTSLCTNNAKGLQFDTLNTLCRYLNVGPGDLFVFVPFDISVGPCYKGGDDISFTVVDERGKSKIYTLPFSVDVEYESFPLDDDGDHINLPESASVLVGSISACGDEPTEEEKTFFSYYNRLPVFIRSYLEDEITEKIFNDIVDDMDPRAGGLDDTVFEALNFHVDFIMVTELANK